MNPIAVANAVKELVTAASGKDCVLGQPHFPPTGDDTWIGLFLDSEYDEELTNGPPDETLSLSIFTLATLVGDTAGAISTLTTITTRAELIKTAFETDPTLGGLAQHTKVKAIKRQPVPASENAWVAAAEIQIEVRDQ
ncbi:MAG: hypothetical protein PF636_10145 [Actinomycetota bacterium]|jgi:hypothetical protein|nr:hypothetical protein [Actinomycetota bacterium]